MLIFPILPPFLSEENEELKTEKELDIAMIMSNQKSLLM